MRQRCHKIIAYVVLFALTLSTNNTYARIIFQDDVDTTDSEGHEIGSNDSTADTDISLQFGGVLGETLQWDSATQAFTLSDDLTVDGSISQNGVSFTLDADETGDPDQDVDIIANQGSESSGILRYNDGDNRWEVSNDGTSFTPLGGEIGTDDILHVYDGIGGILIGSTATNHTFDTIVRADSDYSYTASGTDITIQTTGNYLFNFNCLMDVVGTARYTAQSWIERDTGSGFSEVFGTRTGTYHRTTGDGLDNANINAYLELNAGDVLQVVSQADTNNVIRTVGNGCRITMDRKDNSNGFQGPQGPTGPQGPAGTDGTNGGGWGTDGVTTSTTQNASVAGNLEVTGDIGSPCGPNGIFWMERGGVGSNQAWSAGNGQTPFGIPMGCDGEATRIAAVCTGSIGTSLEAVLYRNNTATGCSVSLSTTSGQATLNNCSENFLGTDVLGIYAGTEVGTWTECVGTFWVKYD